MGMRRIGQAWSAVRPWLAPERDMLNAFAGPWPSDVLAPEARPGYLDWLQRAHPLPDRGPMRQQFAWAHQWLLAGDGTRAAETVQAAMAGSQGPHLGLWTDGTDKADVGPRRAGVRGLMRQEAIAPDNLATAQALLLQLDMLAYLDRSDATPTWVIGAGVPKEWLRHALDSGAIQSALGPLRWKWNGERLIVFGGKGRAIRLAGAFANAPVRREDALP